MSPPRNVKQRGDGKVYGRVILTIDVLKIKGRINFEKGNEESKKGPSKDCSQGETSHKYYMEKLAKDARGET